MAWEWSHTQEAYDNFAANVHDLDRKDLLTIWAEWRAQSRDEESDGFDEAAYKAALEFANSVDLANDVLADEIIVRAEDLRTCENGGFLAWACPFGCGPHLISFDREDSDN